MRWPEGTEVAPIITAFLTMLGTILGGGTIVQLIRGNAPKTKPGETIAEVKGALISDKSAERIVQSSDAFTAAAMMLKSAIDQDVEAKKALTTALNAHVAAMERNAEIIKGNTGAATSVAEQAHDLRDVIGDLAKELEIQSRLKGRGE